MITPMSFCVVTNMSMNDSVRHSFAFLRSCPAMKLGNLDVRQEGPMRNIAIQTDKAAKTIIFISFEASIKNF